MSKSSKYLDWNLARNSLIPRVIPPLSFQSYKGQMGKLAIIGGSPEYTGAPYYSGIGSLKFGGDLAFIFCAKQALLPIKAYSPELMVVSLYDAESNQSASIQTHNSVNLFLQYLPRITSLVIGPGLGRNPIFTTFLSELLPLTNSRNMSVVIDADGLFFVSQSLSLVRGNENCVLTPNRVEFQRLVSAAIQHLQEQDTQPESDPHSSRKSRLPGNPFLLACLTSSDPSLQLAALGSILEGPTVLLKGERDLVSRGWVSRESDGKGVARVWVVGQAGSPRRPGGQGDILSGCVSTALNWALSLSHTSSPDQLPGQGEAECVVRKPTDHQEGEGEGETEGEKRVSENDGREVEENGWSVEEVEVLFPEVSLEDQLSSPSPSFSRRKLLLTSISSTPAPRPSLSDPLSSGLVLPLEASPSELACLLASACVRRAARKAFLLKGRGVTSPDIIEHLTEALEELELEPKI